MTSACNDFPEGAEAAQQHAVSSLAGRHEERSLLARLVAVSSSGRGASCWLEGEQGIGKTVLAVEAAARAAAHGSAVVRVAAADSLADGSEALLDEVYSLCSRGPVVVVMDDLHLAGEASLRDWRRLKRAAGRLPLLLIATAWPPLAQDAVERLRLAAADRGTVIELGPLGLDDIAELARPLVGGSPGARLRSVLDQAGGNPLYAAGLARALAGEGLVKVVDGVADIIGDLPGVPAPVVAPIMKRVQALPPYIQDALAAAALMGSEFGAAEWGDALGRSALETADIAASALAAGLLDSTRHRLRFRHDMIRRVLAGQLPPEARAAQHAGIARRLAEYGHGIQAVARHLLAAPGPLDDWAISWLAHVPHQALSAHGADSASLLRRALETISPCHWRRGPLAASLAQAAFRLGYDEDASRAARDVLAHTGDPELAARMRVQLIRSAIRTSRPRQALEFAARQPADDLLAPAWRARLAAWSAVLYWEAGADAGAAALASRALRIAGECDDPVAIACAGYAATVCGPHGQREAHAGAALGLLHGQDPDSVELRLLLLAVGAEQAVEHGRQPEAESALAAALALARRAGGAAAVQVRLAAADASYRYGQWDDALAHLREAGNGDRAQGLAAVIALRRGDQESAERLLLATMSPLGTAADEAVARAGSDWLALALALRAEAAGDAAGAVEVLKVLLHPLSGRRAQDQHRYLPYLVRLALSAGDSETARAAAAACAERVVAGSSRDRVTAVRLCRALLADDSAELLAVAADCDAFAWSPWQAFALEEAAARLAAVGHRSGARAALTAAVRRYEDMGAVLDKRRADARLRQYSVRRGPHSLRERPLTGWDALTPAERKVVTLLVQGKSNPDIAARLVVSPTTVKKHVSSILRKLGLRSRVDVVRAAARRGQATD